jgi:hypothetical protein
MKRPTLRQQAAARSRYHLQRVAADLLAEGQSRQAVLDHLTPLYRQEQARLAAMGPALDQAAALLALVEKTQTPPPAPLGGFKLPRGTAGTAGTGGGRRRRGGRGGGLE